jgi:hypothetical protein
MKPKFKRAKICEYDTNAPRRHVFLFNRMKLVLNDSIKVRNALQPLMVVP